MTLAAAALVALAVAGAQKPADAFQTLDVWLTAVERHRAGRNDEAVASMAALNSWQIEAALPYLARTIETAFRGSSYDPGPLLKRMAARVSPNGAERQRIAILAERIARGRDVFLKRAAMLHADVGVFAPGVHMTMSEGASNLVNDGVAAGNRGRPWHWMLGRALLDLVSDRRNDPDVLAWYRGVGMYLRWERDFTEAMPHVRTALTLFPRDAELHFLRGLLHETLAAPHIQAARTEAVTRYESGTSRMTVVEGRSAVRSAHDEREDAIDAFRRALDLDPSHAEARIRLARLVTLSGKPDDAAEHLSKAIAGRSDDALKYLAQLFLGRAEELRRRREAARAAYAEASRLFPHAPSAKLALAQLSARAGDRRSAAALVDGIGVVRDPELDPWWVYFNGTDAHVNRALRRVWNAFEGVR